MVAVSPLGYPTVIGGYGAIELSQTLGNRLGRVAVHAWSSIAPATSFTGNWARFPRPN